MVKLGLEQVATIVSAELHNWTDNQADEKIDRVLGKHKQKFNRAASIPSKKTRESIQEVKSPYTGIIAFNSESANDYSQYWQQQLLYAVGLRTKPTHHIEDHHEQAINESIKKIIGHRAPFTIKEAAAIACYVKEVSYYLTTNNTPIKESDEQAKVMHLSKKRIEIGFRTFNEYLETHNTIDEKFSRQQEACKNIATGQAIMPHEYLKQLMLVHIIGDYIRGTMQRYQTNLSKQELKQALLIFDILERDLTYEKAQKYSMSYKEAITSENSI